MKCSCHRPFDTHTHFVAVVESARVCVQLPQDRTELDCRSLCHTPSPGTPPSPPRHPAPSTQLFVSTVRPLTLFSHGGEIVRGPSSLQTPTWPVTRRRANMGHVTGERRGPLLLFGGGGWQWGRRGFER